MQNATIITAPHGLGIYLEKEAINLGLQTDTYGISAGNIGISTGIPAQPVDHMIDTKETYDLDSIQFMPSKYLIWSTGVFLKSPLSEMTDEQIINLSELHYSMPLRLIHRFQQQHKFPYHLIVIASCSSWRLREQEAVYCGLSAAKATFARNIASDLHKGRPGSKVTLINPGGVRTPFYYELEEQGEGFIDFNWLSKYIWEVALNQNTVFEELQILRKKPVVVGSLPDILYGQKIPETCGAS